MHRNPQLSLHPTVAVAGADHGKVPGDAAEPGRFLVPINLARVVWNQEANHKDFVSSAKSAHGHACRACRCMRVTRG